MQLATHMKIFGISFKAKMLRAGWIVPYGFLLFFLLSASFEDGGGLWFRFMLVVTGVLFGLLPVQAALSAEVLRLFGFSTGQIRKQVLVGFVLILPVVQALFGALYLLSERSQLLLLAWPVSVLTGVIGLVLRMRSAATVATPTTFGERMAQQDAVRKGVAREIDENLDPVRELIRKPLQKTLAILAAVAAGFTVVVSLWLTISAMVQQRAVEFDVAIYFIFILSAAVFVMPDMLASAYISWKAFSLSSAEFRAEPYRNLWPVIPMVAMFPTIYFLVHGVMRAVSPGYAEFNPAYSWSTVFMALLVAAGAGLLMLLAIPLLFLLNIRWAGWAYWLFLISGIAVTSGVLAFMAVALSEGDRFSGGVLWTMGLLGSGVLSATSVGFYQWALPRVDLSRAGQSDTFGVRG